MCNLLSLSDELDEISRCLAKFHHLSSIFLLSLQDGDNFVRCSRSACNIS